jgi:elongator complex protein 4
LLAGHAGLALNSSLLIEESGTTDYAGALLRFYAAEGLLQGHHVHVVGVQEHWGRELPGVVGDSEKKEKSVEKTEKMKIAWRYEGLGQFGTAVNARGGHTHPCIILASSNVTVQHHTCMLFNDTDILL